ncbi:MAG: hypothetical protein Q9170_001189 [Blastenia crenularia]
MTSIHQNLYPTPARTEILENYLGKKLQDVSTPTAVVDRAIVRRNCEQMLQACRALGCSFRPHVKTHKTVEVTRFQVGDASTNVHVVVSTLAEFDCLVDYLLECEAQGKSVNQALNAAIKVLYGIPAPPSTIRKLAQLGTRLRPGSVSVLVDHPDQLQHLGLFKEITGYRLLVYIKIDTGYHRAGITHDSSQFPHLVSALFPDGHDLPCTEFHGLYSHAGHSYGKSSPDGAMELLIQEIKTLQLASNCIGELFPGKVQQRIVLSVGATPTATSIQYMANHGNDHIEHALKPGQADMLGRCLRDIHATKDFLELHAGVYPFLDLQQLATEASPSASTPSAGLAISTHDVALTVLTEVASLYNERDEHEALISAGSLALGREPCKSYRGWGLVSDWNVNSHPTGRSSCWEVGRISQEHGILTQHSSGLNDIPELHVGQKLRVFPNHACIAGAHFGWYLVVDSDLAEEKRDEIVDVWIRCRGW